MSRAGIPKYLRLVEAIEDLVRDGTLPQGLRLPAESMIANDIPMSLGTIQKAMAVLQDCGIVSREHGRGTFVRGIPSELRDLWHFRFLGDDSKTILPVYPHIVGIKVIDKHGPWAEFLGAEAKFIRITRIIDVNHEFDVASEYYVSHRKCKGLLTMREERVQHLHLRDILRERFGLNTARVVEQVSCETFPPDITSLIESNSPVGLVCRLLAFDYRDDPVSFHVMYVPPDTRRLEMRERKP